MRFNVEFIFGMMFGIAYSQYDDSIYLSIGPVVVMFSRKGL